MHAVRVHDTDLSSPYSATYPAPPSALHVDGDVEIPLPSRPGEVLVRIHASAVVRDELTWPETYHKKLAIPGHDFSGTVVRLHESIDKQISFRTGDEVYGMVAAEKAGIWAEYAVVEANELALKPRELNWEEAAAVPLSGLTAWQALFDHGKISAPDLTGPTAETTQDTSKPIQTLLITGAAGGVGIYAVQLAALAKNLHVVAATSSNDRNKTFLESLGAHEVIEYQDLSSRDKSVDVVIDMVGGKILEKCWSVVKDHGTLVSIDSASYDFVKEHREKAFTNGKKDVDAKFFIVECSSEQLERLRSAIDQGLVKVFVAETFLMKDAKLAYKVASEKLSNRGKVILNCKMPEIDNFSVE